MTSFVVDPRVAAKWFAPEEHAKRAAQLIAPGQRLTAPELIAAELGNVAWKKHLRGELSSAEAQAMLAGFARLAVVLQPIAPLVRAALVLATDLRRSVYDCLYLALAMRETAPLVTADRRFDEAVAGSRLAPRILWIEDLP